MKNYFYFLSSLIILVIMNNVLYSQWTNDYLASPSYLDGFSSMYFVNASTYYITKNNVISHPQSISLNDLKLKNNRIINIHQNNIQNYKSPFLSGVLSFFVPGFALGQFYNEQYTSWIIRLGISVLSASWFFFSPNIGDGPSSGQKIIALLVYLVNWIASVIDAPISANRLNNIQRNHKFNNNFNLNLNFKKYLGISLSYIF